MRLHIHIGAHKTATTHMQLCLGGARQPLRRRGVRFFGPRNLREVPGEGLAAALSARASADLVDYWRAGLAKRLTACRLALLSEENFVGTMDPQMLFGRNGDIYPEAGLRVARLLELAGGMPATLFLGVRNPTDFVTSAYGMHLALGNPPILSEYVGDFPVARISWSGLAERLLATDGVERVVVWAYEDFRVIRSQVLGALVGSANARLIPDKGRALTGWSRDAYRLYRDRYLAADEGSDLRALARDARASLPKVGDRKALQPFDGLTRRRAAARYSRDLERLRAMAGVTFLQPVAAARSMKTAATS